MRIISTNSLVALEEENLRLFLLVDIEIDSNHYRFTDCDIPLVYDNYLYEPYPFSIDNINSSMDQAVDSINLKITELNSALGIYLKDNDLNGNPRNIQKNNVTIYYAVCSGDLLTDDAYPEGELLTDIDEIILDSDGSIVYGSLTIAGSYKITRLESDGTLGDDLIFYRYESSTWVEKMRITP